MIALLYLEAPEEASIECERLAARLSPEERDRASGFRFDHDRNAFVAAHALLRFALHQATGRSDWSFDVGPHGKPGFAAEAGGGDLEFNITHTPGLAACALATGGAIGVDAELRKRVVDVSSVAERHFTADERRQLDEAGRARNERFIQIWTLKEAIAKALGAGLSMDLRTFSVTKDPCAVRLDDGSNLSWRLGLTLLPRHCLAVALKSAQASPMIPEWRRVSWSELGE